MGYLERAEEQRKPREARETNWQERNQKTIAQGRTLLSGRKVLLTVIACIFGLPLLLGLASRLGKALP